MCLWWFVHHCRIRKMALPGLLPMVWLVATAISGVNASVLCGLFSIIWFIIPDSSAISECSTSLTDTLHGARSIARGTPFTELCAKRSPQVPSWQEATASSSYYPSNSAEDFPVLVTHTTSVRVYIAMGSILTGIFWFHALRRVHQSFNVSFYFLYVNCLDISVDTQAHLSYIVVWLKRSKNDPFAVGARVSIGATNQSVCPVTVLLGYLAIHPKRSGPLFIFQDGSTLLREMLVSSLRQVLLDVSMSTAQYSGHSFYIGAATMAAKLGAFIKKMMGRLKSSVFIFALRGSSWQASYCG